MTGEIGWACGLLAIATGLAIAAHDIARWLARRIRYSHRQRMAAIRDYELREAEHVGRHRAPWSVPLDDQPAGVIAAVVTDVRRRA